MNLKFREIFEKSEKKDDAGRLFFLGKRSIGYLNRREEFK